jgi:hypothetical protein
MPGAGRQSGIGTSPGSIISQSPNQLLISSYSRQRPLPSVPRSSFSLSIVRARSSGSSGPGMWKLDSAIQLPDGIASRSSAAIRPGSSASSTWCKIANSSRPTGLLKSISLRTSGLARISAGLRTSPTTMSVVTVSLSRALLCV